MIFEIPGVSGLWILYFCFVIPGINTGSGRVRVVSTSMKYSNIIWLLRVISNLIKQMIKCNLSYKIMYTKIT